MKPLSLKELFVLLFECLILWKNVLNFTLDKNDDLKPLNSYLHFLSSYKLINDFHSSFFEFLPLLLIFDFHPSLVQSHNILLLLYQRQILWRILWQNTLPKRLHCLLIVLVLTSYLNIFCYVVFGLRLFFNYLCWWPLPNLSETDSFWQRFEQNLSLTSSWRNLRHFWKMKESRIKLFQADGVLIEDISLWRFISFFDGNNWLVEV